MKSPITREERKQAMNRITLRGFHITGKRLPYAEIPEAQVILDVMFHRYKQGVKAVLGKGARCTTCGCRLYANRNRVKSHPNICRTCSAIKQQEAHGRPPTKKCLQRIAHREAALRWYYANRSPNPKGKK